MWEKIVKKQSRLIAINLLFVNRFLEMVRNRSAAPHLLRSLALRSLSCYRPGSHLVCIANRPLSRICRSSEAALLNGYNSGAAGILGMV